MVAAVAVVIAAIVLVLLTIAAVGSPGVQLPNGIGAPDLVWLVA